MMPVEEKETLTDASTKVFWRGPGAGRLHSTSRLFKSTLMNPYPARSVATIDFVSSHNFSAYQLTAATVANHDSSRATSPSFPASGPAHNFDGTVRLRVVDLIGGKPLTGAVIETGMNVDGAGCVGPVLIADTNGEATLRYPKGATQWLSAMARSEHYAQQEKSWSGNIPDDYEFRLESAYRIGGVVEDEKGAILAGVEIGVVVRRGLEINPQMEGIGISPAHTDSQGRWSLELSQNVTNFVLIVKHPNYFESLFVSSESFAADKAAHRNLGESSYKIEELRAGTAVLKLKSGPKFNGVIHNDSGQPISHAIISATRENAMDSSTAVTDSSGRFNFKNLKAGDYSLVVSAETYAPDFRDFAAGETNSPLDITLKKGRVIRGKVVDKNGQPIAGARVEFEAVKNSIFHLAGRNKLWTSETAKDGSFMWYSAPHPGALFQVFAAG